MSKSWNDTLDYIDGCLAGMFIVLAALCLLTVVLLTVVGWTSQAATGYHDFVQYLIGYGVFRSALRARVPRGPVPASADEAQ